MSNSAPFFSVITATHRRPFLLWRALQSIREQPFQDVEIILVTDAVDPETFSVAAELLGERDTFLKRTGPEGPAMSRNLGMEFARGEWVVFLDDDDRFGPTHLQAMYSHAQTTQDHVLYSDYEVVTEDRTQPGVPPLTTTSIHLGATPTASLHIKNFIPNNALLYRRSILEGCQVDAHLSSQEDWDFLLGVLAKTTPVYVPGGCAIVHKDYVNPGARRGTQAAANDSTALADFLQIYRRWPAPTPELKEQRKEMLKSAGLDLPASWF